MRQSSLTAWQVLFEHGGLAAPARRLRRQQQRQLGQEAARHRRGRRRRPMDRPPRPPRRRPAASSPPAGPPDFAYVPQPGRPLRRRLHQDARPVALAAGFPPRPTSASDSDSDSGFHRVLDCVGGGHARAGPGPAPGPAASSSPSSMPRPPQDAGVHGPRRRRREKHVVRPQGRRPPARGRRARHRGRHRRHPPPTRSTLSPSSPAPLTGPGGKSGCTDSRRTSYSVLRNATTFYSVSAIETLLHLLAGSWPPSP